MDDSAGKKLFSNIGLVNDMKIVANRMDIEIHTVIRAVATMLFSFVPYYSGHGALHPN